jgi:hypothetical protein
MNPAEFLSTLMAEAQLTAAQLAQEAKLRPSQIATLLGDHRRATLGSFMQAVDACGYTLEFRLQTAPPPAPPMLAPAEHPTTAAKPKAP